MPRIVGCYRALYCRTDLFQNSFLTLNKLDPYIKTFGSRVSFRKELLTFIKPSEKSIYNIYDPQRSKLVNRLRFCLSHLRKNKFRHNFADTVHEFLKLKAWIIFFSRYQNYAFLWTTLMNELSSINSEIVSLRPTTHLEVIIYGSKKPKEASLYFLFFLSVHFYNV